MKKSEFKQLIKEALIEVLPVVLPSILEEINQPANTSLLTRNDVKERFNLSKPKAISVEKPSNERTGFNGEPYASGKGLMEWYKKSTDGQSLPTESEFKHTDDELNAFIKSKING
jgi:hypothetical protein